MEDQYGGPQPQLLDRSVLLRDHGLPFVWWSSEKIAGYLANTGFVASISRESVRQIMRASGIKWQATET